MTTYLAAADAPLKNTGQIKLYSAEDFDGMRRACPLTAACLDEVAKMVEPGRPTMDIDTTPPGIRTPAACRRNPDRPI